MADPLNIKAVRKSYNTLNESDNHYKTEYRDVDASMHYIMESSREYWPGKKSTQYNFDPNPYFFGAMVGRFFKRYSKSKNMFISGEELLKGGNAEQRTYFAKLEKEIEKEKDEDSSDSSSSDDEDSDKSEPGADVDFDKE